MNGPIQYLDFTQASPLATLSDRAPEGFESYPVTVEQLRSLVDGGWRYIASAPRDGVPFMVWADGYEWPEVIRWYEYDAECAEDAGESGYFHYAEELLHDVLEWEHEVTHWQPLPAPPSVSAQSGAEGRL